MEILTKSPGQTKKIGEVLAKEILKTKLFGKALIIALEGDLGGGKTTFLQGFAKGLGIREKILSPTFVIVKKSKIQSAIWRTKFKNFYHIDCYRIEKPRDVSSLRLREIISNSQNVVAIEWSNRIRKILPKRTLTLKFYFVGKNKRKILIKNG